MGKISEIINVLKDFAYINLNNKKNKTTGKPEILIVIASMNKIPDRYLLKLYINIPDNISNGA